MKRCARSVVQNRLVKWNNLSEIGSEYTRFFLFRPDQFVWPDYC